MPRLIASFGFIEFTFAVIAVKLEKLMLIMGLTVSKVVPRSYLNYFVFIFSKSQRGDVFIAIPYFH